MKARTHLLPLLAFGALALLSGCVTTSTPSHEAPLASAAYRINILDARLPQSLDAVIAACDATLRDLNFTRTERKDDDNAVSLMYRGQGDLGVRLKLTAREDHTTLRIRYGLTGNEYQSRQILEAVVKRL